MSEVVKKCEVEKIARAFVIGTCVSMPVCACKCVSVGKPVHACVDVRAEVRVWHLISSLRIVPCRRLALHHWEVIWN